ncbi:MAG: zinc metalloprotease HtpX [Candidatus Omnitrophota bacterium]
MNYLKTGILLIALTFLFLVVGQAIGGRTGVIYAFIFALVFNVGSYWFSDKIVLAMYRAAPLARSEAPQVYQILEGLAVQARLPMPKVYMIPQEAPNAFATGRNPQNACVCVTKGLTDLLDHGQLKGVLAHELAHVKNRDMLIMTMTAVIAGAVMMLANMARWSAIFGGYGRDRNRGGNVFGLLAVSIIAPIAALLIQLAISRSREYAADAAGARFAMNSTGLAEALKKMQGARGYRRLEAAPQTAHLFIVNPLKNDFISNLFSTHPPIEERIKRLRGMKIV